MGLDMYLEKYPRVGGVRPETIDAVDDYIKWRDGERTHSFEEWTGREKTELPPPPEMAVLETYRHTSYAVWDENRRFPHDRISEQVGYWRKANAVHKWFVDNVQGGEDDCAYHREVTADDLETLRDLCKTILLKSVLAVGKIENGYSLEGGRMVKQYTDGFKVVNAEVCEEMLPTQKGFFFGGTEYNEYYGLQRKIIPRKPFFGEDDSSKEGEYEKSEES